MGRTPRGVIVHQLRRAMGRDERYELLLTDGTTVPGPIAQVLIDRELDQLVDPTSGQSTLIAVTPDGRVVHVNDVEEVRGCSG